MAKLLVETKGDIQVYGDGEELHAHFNRPSVVRQGNFMAGHVSSGNLILLGQLTDDATDAEFEKVWREAKTDEDREKVKHAFAEKYAPGKAAPRNEAPKK